MHRNQAAVACAFCTGLMLACSAPMFATPTPVPTETPTATLTPVPTATLTPTPMPVVIASGTLEIPRTYQVDLDAGAIPTDPKSPAYADVDLWFDAVTPSERYLEPYGGGSMLVMGAGEVGLDTCRGVQASVARVDINALPAGTYLCVTTNIGNTSIVRVNSIDYSSPGKLRLDFITWHQP
jgi:hypothetical protein